jgi:hypothetical protein
MYWRLRRYRRRIWRTIIGIVGRLAQWHRARCAARQRLADVTKQISWHRELALSEHRMRENQQSYFKKQPRMRF